MQYEYYYNNVPNFGLCRNNLIYTSLISKDKKTFVQWYYNDTEYHYGKNQVVDPELMTEKWDREVKYLTLMASSNPDLVPEIIDIDIVNRKIFLKIDGVDFWQRHFDSNCTYDVVLPSWKSQILNIIQAHKNLNLFKHSMHPSSYFIVDGQLKSINYFFTYHNDEDTIAISEVKSHISSDRQVELKKYTDSLGISWDQKYSHKFIQQLTFDCFSNNYPKDFIIEAKRIYD
jgi:hypothetical protein